MSGYLPCPGSRRQLDRKLTYKSKLIPGLCIYEDTPSSIYCEDCKTTQLVYPWGQVVWHERFVAHPTFAERKEMRLRNYNADNGVTTSASKKRWHRRRWVIPYKENKKYKENYE